VLAKIDLRQTSLDWSKQPAESTITGCHHHHCPSYARAASPEVLASGGSCVAGPEGEWLVAPSGPVEELFVTTIDHRRVLEERQNFRSVRPLLEGRM